MNKYRLLKMNSRGGRYYAEEIETGLRHSLKTKDLEAAEKLLHAMNEAHRNPQLNRRMAQTYLAGSDPEALTRTWKDVITAIVNSKKDGSDDQHRWTSVSKDPAYGLIMNEALLSTTPDTLLAVLKMGTVSTNVFLAHPELCLGHGMAAVAHPEEETVPQGQIPAKAGHHREGAPEDHPGGKEPGAQGLLRTVLAPGGLPGRYRQFDRRRYRLG